jgi:hypothetical protein
MLDIPRTAVEPELVLAGEIGQIAGRHTALDGPIGCACFRRAGTQAQYAGSYQIARGHSRASYRWSKAATVHRRPGYSSSGSTAPPRRCFQYRSGCSRIPRVTW